MSFPLVAMQFALRQFCKCAEYCIVCHLKLQAEVVPLKPCVCTNDLCLYQYLALGLGPNIEHKVINNPYVVDLMISFFYIGEIQRGIREFPRGLALRAPVVQRSAPHLEIEVCAQSQQFRIVRASNETMDINIRKRIHNGDWFAMIINEAVCKSNDSSEQSATIVSLSYKCLILSVKAVYVIQNVLMSTQTSRNAQVMSQKLSRMVFTSSKQPAPSLCLRAGLTLRFHH